MPSPASRHPVSCCSFGGWRRVIPNPADQSRIWYLRVTARHASWRESPAAIERISYELALAATDGIAERPEANQDPWSETAKHKPDKPSQGRLEHAKGSLPRPVETDDARHLARYRLKQSGYRTLRQPNAHGLAPAFFS